MNKKVLTLCVSALLAGAVGTANAQTTPHFVKYTEKGTVATNIKQGQSFQLATGDKDGTVLALTRTTVNGQYEYELALVRPVAGAYANLAETLWDITYTENEEGGPSFTFVSAAYGIPLSFSPKNANAGGLINEYPGTDGLWKWMSSTSVTGSNSFAPQALINNYSEKLDSAIVLVSLPNSGVAARRYKTSAGVPSDALKLQPVVASEVVLSVDDLNSMFMTQSHDKKFKLTFNDDVQGSEIGNLWTKGLLKAVPAIAKSTSAYMIQGSEEATYYTADEAKAAANGYAAAKHVNTKEYAQELVNSVSKKNDVDAVKTFIGQVAAAAVGDDFKAAKDAALAVTSDKTEEITTNAANAAAAAVVKTTITGEYGNAIEGENNTKTALEGAIDAVTGSTQVPDALTALKNAFKADEVLGGEDTYANQEAIDAVYKAADELATKFAEKEVPADKTFSSETDAESYVIGLYAASGSVETVLKEYITNENFSNALSTSLNMLAEDAKDISEAIKAAKMTLPEEAMTTEQYLASLSDATFLATITGEGFTAENVKTIADAVAAKINAQDVEVSLDECKTLAGTVCDSYKAVESADELTTAISKIEKKLNAVDINTVKEEALAAATGDGSDYATSIGEVIGTALADACTAARPTSIETAIEAILATNIKKGGVKVPSIDGEEVENPAFAQYVSLSLDKKTKVEGVDKDLYLAVDTNFVTSASGRRHLTFAEWYYDMPERTNGTAMSTSMQRDYNGHFNFKFTYYPTQDSMVIVTDGYAMKPQEGTGSDYWVNIPEAAPTHYYEGNGNTVMLAVLTNGHTEATVGIPQQVSGTNHTTLNTRIGFNANPAIGATIAPGVYTIQYISTDAKKKDLNGRYVVMNWLSDGQAMASVEDQNLNHIPAAQWMLTHENGSNINTIVNRETNDDLTYFSDFAYAPVQYLYATATADLYTTVYGDSLKLNRITDNTALADSTLGYYAAAKYNEETADQLEVYALKYLNETDGLFVNYNEDDSVLNVTPSEEAEVYFRLIPAQDFAPVHYGPTNDVLAKDLYRQAYYIQLETQNKNVKDEDKLYITSDAEGKYRLVTREANAKKELTWNNVTPFFLKEFKEVDGTCNYALIEAGNAIYEKGKQIGYNLGWNKVSVKDYPSTLVVEDLEGENQANYTWGYKADGRTSTFALIAKDAPKYRRLNVTNPEDGLKDNDVNYAKFFQTRNPNRFLYENTANAVAGYESEPLGLNFLGDYNTTEKDKNAAIFVDTAYVRNNTNRPQYMLALRPDFTPVLEDCPYDPSHGKHEIPQVKASYLVTLTDSVANAVNKAEQDKFMYENRTYTRLAFVDAIHRGDQLIILNSKFTGTDKAANDTIDLSKNAFVEGAWQFRLTGNDNAEFYIEGAKSGEFIRLVNGVAVLTDDISDAERFNIEVTDEAATANESITANGAVSVVATDGAVVIKGAEGKNVVIATILGKVVANETINSDNETIAVPAGIAVVSVDGESFKVVVK